MSSVTDLTSWGSLKNLRLTGRTGLPEMSKLGKRINTTGAVPVIPKTGLLVSANFNGNLGSIAQAVENTEFANSLFLLTKNGVQSILEHVNNIYGKIKESLPLNGSPTDSDILNSNQASIDESIESINAIAENTTFNNTALFNGSFAFNLSDISPEIEHIRLLGLELKDGYPMNVDVIVTAAPLKAKTGTYIAGVQSQDSEIRLTGEFGTQTLKIPAYSTKSEVEELINSVKKLTGVEAEDGRLQSVFYGSTAFIKIEELSGNLEGISEGTYYGSDIEGAIYGRQAEGSRNILSINTPASKRPSGKISDAGISRFGVVSSAPQPAQTGLIAAVQSQASQIKITGTLGNQTINIPISSTQQQVENLINGVKSLTGVEAENGYIRSTTSGSSAFVEITELSGDLEDIAPGKYYGKDTEGTIYFQSADAGDNDSLPLIDAVITMSSETKAGTYGFNVSGGMLFQTGTRNLASSRILTGIDSLNAARLGKESDTEALSTLLSGSENDIFRNPVKALEIAEKAKSMVDALYAQIQSLEYGLFNANMNEIEDSFGKLIDDGGAIKDGNIANHITKSLKQGVMKNSLALAYKDTALSYRSVLKLLT